VLPVHSFTPEPLTPLATNVLADQIADRIVEAIALRRLASGERLVETDLAQALGVSRVPIREATRILASQGVVVPTPRRGMRVATFDRAWAVQLHDARVAIERLAAHTLAARLKSNPELVVHLRNAIERIEREVEYPRDGWLAINRADIAFHGTVFDLAGSPLLSTLWSAISRHVLIMFAIETYRDSEFRRVAAEHHTYLEAVLSGNKDIIDEEIERHVAGARIFGNRVQLPMAQQEDAGDQSNEEV
jgi:DNA-binding GntR family transcriptional regulator